MEQKDYQISDYIPHRYPILLIDKVVSFTKDSIICACEWKNKLFCHDENGSLIPSTMIEMAAQSAAVMHGINARAGEKPKLGMLTAVKKFEFFNIPLTTEFLTIEITTEGQLGNHKIVQGKIKQNKEVLAQGLIFLYVNE